MSANTSCDKFEDKEKEDEAPPLASHPALSPQPLSEPWDLLESTSGQVIPSRTNIAIGLQQITLIQISSRSKLDTQS